MKKFCFAFISLFLLSNTHLQSQDLGDLSFGGIGSLDIATWNIEWFPKNGQITVEYVTEIIEQLDLDILAIQEVYNTDMFDQMLDSLLDYTGFYESAWFAGLAYIYKTEVVEINDIYEIYTTSPYWSAFPRSPMVMDMNFMGKNYFLINNHFKCCGDGYLDFNNESDEEKRRYNAVNLLKEYIDTNLSDKNVFVLGDLNDDIAEEPQNNVFQMILDDSDNYLFADIEIANGSSYGWSYPSWPSHLDHILITNELFDELDNSDVQTIKIDDYVDGGWNEYDQNISDHRPVAVKFDCADADSDGCLDSVDDAQYEWDDDYDNDGSPDDCDADDDNDGLADAADSDDNNEFVCSDVDFDTCDDCTSSTYDPANDGEDYDADGMCDLGDMDDDNDGTIDSEDCAPFHPAAFEVDCCGVCGGDNSSCSNCCGTPFGGDCASDCVEDEMGVCCLVDDLDECSICYGDNVCLCDEPFSVIYGHCLHQDDIAVLQAFIDNSLNSGFIIEGCDSNNSWCSSPNLYMDQSDNWHEVVIDGQYYQFSNDNGIVEPLELGLQHWVDGRITSLMCGAYIYCQLSGEIPNIISNLTEINILRLEVNYFTGLVPESICDFENLNYDDDLSFDLSYNQLCPPYPECIQDGAINYMDTSECWINGDVNYDGLINVLDVVSLVNAILEGIDIDSGDINGDNIINVIDVVLLVATIIGGS